MTRKTYAARGLLDWQMALNVAGAIIRICFSGGSMGANGVIPAKYTTENLAIQKIIENTPEFRSGKIYVVFTPIEDEDSKADKNYPKTR